MALMKRALLLVLLSACAGTPDPSSPMSSETATAVAGAASSAAAPAPVGSLAFASASSASGAASAPRQCDDRDLDTVLFERERVGVNEKPDRYIDKKVKVAVIACFEEIPRDRRSTDAVHAVTLEWPNTGFQGSSSGDWGRGFGRGGGGDYPPKVKDDGFTACVTKAVPKEHVSSLHPEGSKISAIKLTVLAYTRGAVNRHLTGSIGGGGQAAGFGRGSRRCMQPDRDD